MSFNSSRPSFSRVRIQQKMHWNRSKVQSSGFSSGGFPAANQLAKASGQWHAHCQLRWMPCRDGPIYAIHFDDAMLSKFHGALLSCMHNVLVGCSREVSQKDYCGPKYVWLPEWKKDEVKYCQSARLDSCSIIHMSVCVCVVCVCVLCVCVHAYAWAKVRLLVLCSPIVMIISGSVYATFHCMTAGCVFLAVGITLLMVLVFGFLNPYEKWTDPAKDSWDPKNK